jgi:GTP-binding protein HflX
VGDVLDQEVDGEDIRFDVRLKQNEFDKQGYMLQAFMAQEAIQHEGENV